MNRPHSGTDARHARRSWRVAVAVAALVAFTACGQSQKAPPPSGEVTVFAAASLAEVFDGAAAVLREHGIKLRMNYGGSQVLAGQIKNGAEGDLFASADERWMRDVIMAGHVVEERHVFAHNRLVVITPISVEGEVQSLQDLAKPGVKVVLGVEQSPIGRYTRQSLSKMTAIPGFGADFVDRVLANVVSAEDDVKQVVAKVQLREADAGIVYQSDLTESVGRYATAIAIPDSLNVLATYEIAALRKSANPRAGRAFINFLLSKEGQTLLAGRGFLPVAMP
jgi:molybdate transport system substrate-binding protein